MKVSAPTAPASIVRRITVTGVVAVLACAGVLGTVATLLARQALENQARETLANVGDAASVRVGEWVSTNLRTTGSASVAAQGPDAIAQALAQPTRAGRPRRPLPMVHAAHAVHAGERGQ